MCDLKYGKWFVFLFLFWCECLFENECYFLFVFVVLVCVYILVSVCKIYILNILVFYFVLYGFISRFLDFFLFCWVLGMIVFMDSIFVGINFYLGILY